MVGVAAVLSIWEGGIPSVLGISSGLGLAAATPTDISYVLHGYWLLPPLLPLQILHLQTLHMRYMVAYGVCGVLGLWVGCVAVSVWMRGGRRLLGCSFWGVDGWFFFGCYPCLSPADAQVCSLGLRLHFLPSLPYASAIWLVYHSSR
ncbi:hypothetical protein U1Q18_025438 [Sarracenia purpurea var. burkii]